MRQFLICTFLFSQMYLLSQDTFVKIFEEPYNQLGGDLIVYEEHVYMLMNSICENIGECVQVLKLTYEGDEVWRRRVTWIDAGYKTMCIHNDTITLSGNRAIDNEAYLMLQMNTDGDSLQSATIVDPNRALNGLYMLTTACYKGKVLLAGNAAYEDEQYATIFAIRHNDLSIDTIIDIDKSQYDNDIYDIDIGQNEDIIVFKKDKSENNEETRSVVKIDSNYGTIDQRKIGITGEQCLLD